METPKHQPPESPGAKAAKAVSITLLAVNDEVDEPRVTRLVLSTSDGSVLAALEDHEEDEQATLARAGLTDCVSGPHFFVDPKEYERVLAAGGQQTSVST
jgi:hypothetical protein